MSLSDKQKAARIDALGSSDAPIVAGLSPYKSPVELFYQLTGALPRYTDDETEQQKIGSRIEPVLAELTAEKLGLKIRRCPTRKHPVHSFMVASLDYEIIGNAKGPAVLELKNRSGERPWDALKDDVAIQVAHQLAVTNRDWGIVSVLFGFGNLKTYEVERDRELEDFLIEIESRFMVRVQNSEPPDHTWTPETVDILKRLYPRDSGKSILLPDELSVVAQGFLQTKVNLDDYATMKAGYEGTLKSAMGDATTALCPGYSLSWKCTKDGSKFDLEEFEKKEPALFAQYQKKVPGHRVFRVKLTKEMIP